MPIVPSEFRPPRLIHNGHLQTILPVVFPRRFQDAARRERLELADGDFLDLDWYRAGCGRIAVLTHGLEGASTQGYIRGLAAALLEAGWDVLAWNFRSCGGVQNRLPRFYHSGDTLDLGVIVQHAAKHAATVALIGFSLGGNVTLKYLTEPACHPAVTTGVAISVPVDLASSARKIDRQLSNRIYRRRFLKTMVAKIASKAAVFPGRFDVRGLDRIKTLEEFDDLYTAPLHGFRDAADYWSQSSAGPRLAQLPVPTLLINARNDPFLSEASFPWSTARASQLLHLEAPASGGHVGFLDLQHGLQPWSERRVVQWLETVSGPPAPAPGPA